MTTKHTIKEVTSLIDSHWPRRDGMTKVDIRDAWPIIEVRSGWADVLYHAHHIAMDYNPDYVVHQIKEKFGGLRFYANIPAVTEVMIENLSLNVCETCGEFGSLSSRSPHGWLTTLCREHRAEDYKITDEWERISSETS